MRVRTLSGLGRMFEMGDDIWLEKVGQKVQLVQQLDQFPQSEGPQEPTRGEDGPADVARRDGHRVGLAVERPVRNPARHASAVIAEALAEDEREVRLLLRDDGGGGYWA